MPSTTRAEADLNQMAFLLTTIGWRERGFTVNWMRSSSACMPGKTTPNSPGHGELNLNVIGYPEYCHSAARDKRRIVVAGSHGKTSITAMLLHVMHRVGRTPDFMVGAS